MVGRYALAHDATGHRHELQVEIFDAKLVDLLAYFGDELFPARRVNEFFDVRQQFDAVFHEPTPACDLKRQISEPQLSSREMDCGRSGAIRPSRSARTGTVPVAHSSRP